MKIKFLADKIYYNFFSGKSNPEITNCKIPTDVIGALKYIIRSSMRPRFVKLPSIYCESCT